MKNARIPLFILLIVILSTSIFTFVFFDNNFLIRKWNLPIDPPGFLDSRLYAWASESYAMGYDPLVENPQNPIGQKLNYPRIWHVFFHLGINESHTPLIGTIIVLLFFVAIGLFWFAKGFDTLTYLALFIAFLSPAVMLGIERSNIELILFFVLTTALLANNRSSISALFIVVFGSILKLYPIFGLLFLFKEIQRKFWVLFLSGLGVFILYGILSLDDFMHVFSTTPKLVNSSHGINVWWMGIRHPRVFAIPLSESAIFFFQVTTYVISILILVTSIFLSTCKSVSSHLKHGLHLDAFRMGAGIYTGCFLTMNTHDYRLIFLIFTIPQLVEWFQKSGKKILSVPTITLAAMSISLWNAFIMRFLGRPATFVIEEFCNWIMLATLLYLLFVSAPEWFLSYLRRPISFISNCKRNAESEQ